ncbi:hypothetical protein L6164_031372 [Bauhinia variegata]|uniref:Uncharacterized protein n=1 Tax=Bauhinia variegata TaxID=167791 RepID=A0ACB9LG01_BAUVA|nr:hypothetical protein L6164_031372 [Bauhinia variegata]
MAKYLGAVTRLRNISQSHLIPLLELMVNSDFIAPCYSFRRIASKASSFSQAPEAYKFNKKISHLIRNGRLSEARDVFDSLKQRNTVTWNSMISGYVQRREMAKARKLFDEMPERDTVSWNLMISGYLSCRGTGYAQQARNLFDQMPERDCVSWNTMISGYSKNRRMEEALKLFNDMPERNVVSWNAIISGFLLNGDVGLAIEYFKKMPEHDSTSLSALISGLIKNGSFDVAARILIEYGDRENDKKDLVHAYNTLIAGYGQRGRVEEARHLFDQIPDHRDQIKQGDGRFKRNVVSWNSMMMCYVKAEDIVAARELFDQMIERDTFSWNTMISGYVHMSDMKEASNLFLRMPNPDTLSWNLIISGFSQVGDLKLAAEFFERMPQKNLISWNSIIAGYEKNEDYKGAVKLFSQMQLLGERPDRHTLSSVLSVCTGLVDLYLGKQIHQLITKSVLPDTKQESFTVGLLVGRNKASVCTKMFIWSLLSRKGHSQRCFSSATPRVLKPGDFLRQTRIFTDEDVLQYSKVSHDCNPLHFDSDSARNVGFEGRLVHGMLVASLFPQIISSHFPGAVYVSQSLSFKLPVYIGDQIISEVEAASLRANRNRYLAKFKTRCYKNGELVLDGEAMALLPTLEMEAELFV